MEQNDLRARGRSMEEAFFAGENERLRLQLRQTVKPESTESLAAASGLNDHQALGGLQKLEVGGDTAAAMTLVPLVAVAWADRELAESERAAVLKAVEAAGIAPGSANHAVLATWLKERPDPELFERWKSFIASLCTDMEPDAVTALKTEIVGKARGVAEAAGGILGFGKISAREKEVLHEVEHAFPV